MKPQPPVTIYRIFSYPKPVIFEWTDHKHVLLILLLNILAGLWLAVAGRMMLQILLPLPETDLQLNINRFDFTVGINCIGAIFTAKTGMFRPAKWQARWQ